MIIKLSICLSGKTPLLHSYSTTSTLYFRHSSYLADDLAWWCSTMRCILSFLIFVFLEFLPNIVNCWADSTVHLSNLADLGPYFLAFLGPFFLAFLSPSFLAFLGPSFLAVLGSSFLAVLGSFFKRYSHSAQHWPW